MRFDKCDPLALRARRWRSAVVEQVDVSRMVVSDGLSCSNVVLVSGCSLPPTLPPCRKWTWQRLLLVWRCALQRQLHYPPPSEWPSTSLHCKMVCAHLRRNLRLQLIDEVHDKTLAPHERELHKHRNELPDCKDVREYLGRQSFLASSDKHR